MCMGCAQGMCWAERTANIRLMVLTLEVSKFSGWLNADAPCHESKGGMRCGARCGPGAGWCAGHVGGAHVEHIAHVCDG